MSETTSVTPTIAAQLKDIAVVPAMASIAAVSSRGSGMSLSTVLTVDSSKSGLEMTASAELRQFRLIAIAITGSDQLILTAKDGARTVLQIAGQLQAILEFAAFVWAALQDGQPVFAALSLIKARPARTSSGKP